MAAPEGLISTRDVCERLGVSARTVYRWRDAGRISSVRIGRHDWYDPAEVDRVAVHKAADWYASNNPKADAQRRRPDNAPDTGAGRAASILMDAGEWRAAGIVARDAVERGEQTEWCAAALRACNANGAARGERE